MFPVLHPLPAMCSFGFWRVVGMHLLVSMQQLTNHASGTPRLWPWHERKCCLQQHLKHPLLGLVRPTADRRLGGWGLVANWGLVLKIIRLAGHTLLAGLSQAVRDESALCCKQFVVDCVQQYAAILCLTAGCCLWPRVVHGCLPCACKQEAWAEGSGVSCCHLVVMYGERYGREEEGFVACNRRRDARGLHWVCFSDAFDRGSIRGSCPVFDSYGRPQPVQAPLVTTCMLARCLVMDCSQEWCQ